MGRAISEVLPFSIGVAISPPLIIAVILVLFSARARVNGPAVGLIVFVLVASISIAGPVVFYLVGGERAADILDEWKAWLSTHNAAVMAVLFLVFGFVLFSQGLRGLTA